MKDAAPVLSGLNRVVRDVDASVAFFRLLDLDSPALARRYNAGFRAPEGPGVRCVSASRSRPARPWTSATGA